MASDMPDTTAPPAETLEELYEQAPCGYLTARRDGVIVRVNATLLDLLGATRAALLGHRFELILTPQARNLYETHCLPWLKSHPALNDIALDLAGANGDPLPVRLSWRRVDDAQGVNLGYRVVVISAVEHAACERALLAEQERTRQQDAAIRALNADLENRIQARTAVLAQSQKMASLGQLTGGVAHDFNNLLTPILITLDLLRIKYISDERALRMTASALSAAERGRLLVSRLLAFARRQHLRPQAVHLDQLVSGMGEAIAHAMGPRIAIRYSFTADLPCARVDPGQLELGLLNLCANARDAMADGGALSISADATTIRHDAHGNLSAGHYVRLSVSDSGSGMAPETLLRATEPFFTTKTIGKGTGLGLSMVYGLAAQSGGMLMLESTPGHGTTATIWLPADQGASPSVEPIPYQENPGQDRALSILLVDDDELVRFATGEMLADLGHPTIQAASGRAALEALRQHASFDLMITDYLMPNMTGVELARIARVTQPDLPVLLVTGYANIDDVDGGGLPRLAKPFSKNDLSRMIRETLADAVIVSQLNRRTLV
jgi:PAS domain S-box-containing protein